MRVGACAAGCSGRRGWGDTGAAMRRGEINGDIEKEVESGMGRNSRRIRMKKGIGGKGMNGEG